MLVKMSGFFAARIDGYERRMLESIAFAEYENTALIGAKKAAV